MKKILIYILTFYIASISYAGDTVKIKKLQYVAINISQGGVMPITECVSGAYSIPKYTSASIKYGFSSSGKDWKDYAFKMPYMGIGLYAINLYRDNHFGSPLSLFFFQGAPLTNIYKRLTLNYEWNLGTSFNWKHYDPVENPLTTAIGTSVNVHFGANLYMKWKFAKKIDLDFGLNYTHFSNGASKYPNSGLNMFSIFAELSYHFNRENIIPPKNNFETPEYEKHIVHEIMLLSSSRHAKMDTVGTNLSTIYCPRDFKVLGISYAFLMAPHFRCRWGPGLDLTYDESSGFEAWREIDPASGTGEDKVKLGKFSERISLGLSLKGEIKMKYYSVFANFGCNIIHGNKKDNRFYQIIGAKLNVTENFFLTFGIKARRFSRAIYLFTNIGFNIKQYKKA